MQRLKPRQLQRGQTNNVRISKYYEVAPFQIVLLMCVLRPVAKRIWRQWHQMKINSPAMQLRAIRVWRFDQSTLFIMMHISIGARQLFRN